LGNTGLEYRYEVTNKCVKVVVGFIDPFQILPQHVSAIHCHHQVVVFTAEATQAISVLWMCVDYSPSSVATCRGSDLVAFLDSWPQSRTLVITAYFSARPSVNLSIAFSIS
jgi:predicted protein tyrosine phosphatase